MQDYALLNCDFVHNWNAQLLLDQRQYENATTLKSSRNCRVQSQYTLYMTAVSNVKPASNQTCLHILYRDLQQSKYNGVSIDLWQASVHKNICIYKHALCILNIPFVAVLLFNTNDLLLGFVFDLGHTWKFKQGGGGLSGQTQTVQTVCKRLCST